MMMPISTPAPTRWSSPRSSISSPPPPRWPRRSTPACLASPSPSPPRRAPPTWPGRARRPAPSPSRTAPPLWPPIPSTSTARPPSPPPPSPRPTTPSRPSITAATIAPLAGSANPAPYGQGLTLTAAVSAVSPGTGTPSGTVTLKDGATALQTDTLIAGQAAFTNCLLMAGSHSLTAVYNGDASYKTNTSSALSQTVTKADSVTTLTPSTNAPVFGQPVTFTAAIALVPSSACPRTGTVQFTVDGSNFGSPATVTTNTTASITNSSLSVGAHLVAAVYSGDTNVNGSSSANLAQTVNKASTSTTISSSSNPSVFDNPVAFTATVSAVSPGAGTGTGTVQFTLDGTNLDNAVTLVGSTATLQVGSELTTGTHAIAAIYSGDANFNTSTSGNLSQTVNASPVTPATGGTNISALAFGGTYTNLTLPSYQEVNNGDIGTGDVTLNAPAGFVFDTGGTAPTVLLNGGTSSSRNINDLTNGSTIALSVTTASLTFHVTNSSANGAGSSPNKLTWQNIRVRPSAGTPLASGNITKAGGSGLASMAGVTDGFTSFGQLTEIPGPASKLFVQTQPSATATAGVIFAQQPVVQIQDKFGNARTAANGAADTREPGYVRQQLRGWPGRQQDGDADLDRRHGPAGRHDRAGHRHQRRQRLAQVCPRPGQCGGQPQTIDRRRRRPGQRRQQQFHHQRQDPHAQHHGQQQGL